MPPDLAVPSEADRHAMLMSIVAKRVQRSRVFAILVGAFVSLAGGALALALAYVIQAVLLGLVFGRVLALACAGGMLAGVYVAPRLARGYLELRRKAWRVELATSLALPPELVDETIDLFR